MLIYIIIATSVVGLLSLIGVILIFQKQVKKSVLKALISVAAGTMLTVSLLDLLPEALESGDFDSHTIAAVVLFSILVFFLLERVIHWHHCHCEEHGTTQEREKKHLAYINLIGDAFHNLIDGFLIASAFMIDVHTGILTTLAVIMHEIPQEISDFGVLLYAGLTKARALLYNLFVALTAIAGGLIFYYFGIAFQTAIPIMAAFAVGNFIYLATADLIPELHHEKSSEQIIKNSLWLFVGVVVIIIFSTLLPHAHG